MGKRMTGNEMTFHDWMNIANSVNSIQGSFSRAENQAHLRGKRDKEKRLADAQDSALNYMQEGFTPEESRQAMQGRSIHGESVNQKMGEVSGLEGPAMNWERQDNTSPYSPEVAEKGFQNAVTTQLDSINKTNEQKAQQYMQQFASMPLDQISTMDAGQFGENAFAARIAQGRLLSDMGKTNEIAVAAYKKRNEVADLQYNEFAAGIKEAENALKLGQKEVANTLLKNLVDKVHTPHKMKLDGDRLRPYITYEGEDKHDDAAYTPQELLGELKKISKTQFTQSFHKHAEFSRKLNDESLYNPITMTNGKDFVQAIRTKDPLSSSFKYEAYSIGQNGGKLPVEDIKQLMAQGYYKFSPGKNGMTGAGGSKKSNTLFKAWDQAVKMVSADNTKFKKDQLSGDLHDIASGAPAGMAVYKEALKLLPSYYYSMTGQKMSPEQIKVLASALSNQPGENTFADTKNKILGTEDQGEKSRVTRGKRKNPFSRENNTALVDPIERALFAVSDAIDAQRGEKGNDSSGMPIIDDPYQTQYKKNRKEQDQSALNYVGM